MSKSLFIHKGQQDYSLHKLQKHLAKANAKGEQTEQFKDVGVSENVVYPIVPNGFADPYPYEKWLAIIGKINPTFSGPNPCRSLGFSRHLSLGSRPRTMTGGSKPANLCRQV